MADVILLLLAVYSSYTLRLDGFDLGRYWTNFLLFAILAVVITIFVFRKLGIYSCYWRYASVDELLLLIYGVTGAAVILSIAHVVITGISPLIPDTIRSVPFIYVPLAVGATAGPRLLVITVSHHSYREKGDIQPISTLVMGAGSAGTMIVRELKQNPHLGLEVVGFLDDNPDKAGMLVHGIRVLGNRHDIPNLVRQIPVQRIIIAMPTAPGKTIREILAICEEAGVETKIIPGVYELLGGSVTVNQLRNVEIEDLLRREPIHTDTAAVEELIRGKRVLVTGGGGSIGGELCRQLLRYHPSTLVVVGHGENSVFEIYNGLRHKSAPLQRISGPPAGPDGNLDAQFSLFGEAVAAGISMPPTELTTVIADIRFPERLRSVFKIYRPEIVFHAAAHKHVPLMELNPGEAISNNVMGTDNLLTVSLETGVERFVLISSDKAVNPTSVMGASKRVAELLVHQAAQASGRPYTAVRFGNVLGSRGSVVLTFKQQIAAGGPLTVTDPDMRRYFMTIPEAVQLVLQAAVLGQAGAVFVLDMGEPVKIMDLAKDMVKLSGLEVGRDIDIVITGRRPGEKLFEELFIPDEIYQRTRHEKIYIAQNATHQIPSDFEEKIRALVNATQKDNPAAILSALQGLIPEFLPTTHYPFEKLAESTPSVPTPG
ncbi:MAG: polysaccharide biosynthesis protein [Chloroflexi bacterium]|nr:polysaccharide biosynthesis protein [Chloroflexota bacterium]